jgi:hypothetical protein
MTVVPLNLVPLNLVPLSEAKGEGAPTKWVRGMGPGVAG